MLQINVNCNDVQIESKPNVTYLSAVIDQDMSAKTMATCVIKKLNSSLKFLFRKSGFLKFKERTFLCSVLLQFCFDCMLSMFTTEVLKKVSKSSYKQSKIKWLDTF